MKDMGFGRKWLKWILFCISSVRFSILINGSPEGFFPSQRGLRQGDPLSTFLFILVMEGLNCMIKRAKANGWIKGFKGSNKPDCVMDIFHLLYADDSLILHDAEVDQLRHIILILTMFEATSGLHVNWTKSQLFPINVVPHIHILAGTLACEIGSLPTTYPGLSDCEDTLVWKGSSTRYFSMKSAYKSLMGNAHSDRSWPWKQIWKGSRRQLPLVSSLCCYLSIVEHASKYFQNELGHAKRFIRPLEILGWWDWWSQTEEMVAEDPSKHLVDSLKGEELQMF
ncbi:PREDICTED: uncharacterized protein LOC109208930 [Nicotiana attenuata]|uniref:uncharacterized protein LOC109208930 n=1 Tax=Nicotiana attenuata TaxID=49451 RepID=UPI00090465F5|nr:PREDICTED: uncharacterized protein LOC109208930 [Nicotiana attenuata]